MGEVESRPPRKRFAIGIDPPKGLAAYDLDKNELVKLMNVTFWDIIETLDIVRESYDIEVVCEAPNENAPVWLGKTRHGNRALVNDRALLKAAQNVGQNKEAAMLIVEWCKRHNVKVTTQRPSKRSMTKLTAEQFNKITGWKGKSNEHTRDAAMLVWDSW